MSQYARLSRAKAARELERELMTMEVVAGDEALQVNGRDYDDESGGAAQLPLRLPASEADPLRGTGFGSPSDTAA